MRERPPGGAEDRADLTGLGRLSERPPPPRRERAAPIIRGISLLLLAIAAAGLPWYFITRNGSDESSSANAKTTTTATASPSPSPSSSATKAMYEVFGVDNCLRIRVEPTTTAAILDCLRPGNRVTSDGQTQETVGRLWRRVYDPFKKAWGWAADQYLKKVS